MNPDKIKESLLSGLFVLVGALLCVWLTSVEINNIAKSLILLTAGTIGALIIAWPDNTSKEFKWYKINYINILILATTLFIISSAVAVYFSMPHKEEPQLNISQLSLFNGTIDAKHLGNTELNSSNIDQIISLIRERIEPENYLVRKTAIRASKQSGLHTIYQICSIYNYLISGDNSTKGWFFVSNPRLGSWQQRAYANETVRMGEDLGFSGIGDDIDFTIMASSLVESIGGTTRIILAINNNSARVYPEVYIGNMEDNDTKSNLDWLRKSYDIKEIYFHSNSSTGDLWLNFDYLNADHPIDHPGGPFYESEESIPIELFSSFAN